MLCHVPEKSRLPILFPQDAYFITFMLLFAVSNGYLVSLTMCLAPRSGDGWEGLGMGRWASSLRGDSSGQPSPSCLQARWCRPVGSGLNCRSWGEDDSTREVPAQ